MKMQQGELKSKLTALAYHPYESRVFLSENCIFSSFTQSLETVFSTPTPTPTPTPSLQPQVGLPSSQKRFLYKQPVQPKSFPDKHVFPAEN